VTQDIGQTGKDRLCRKRHTITATRQGRTVASTASPLTVWHTSMWRITGRQNPTTFHSVECNTAGFDWE